MEDVSGLVLHPHLLTLTGFSHDLVGAMPPSLSTRWMYVTLLNRFLPAPDFLLSSSQGMSPSFGAEVFSICVPITWMPSSSASQVGPAKGQPILWPRSSNRSASGALSAHSSRCRAGPRLPSDRYRPTCIKSRKVQNSVTSIDSPPVASCLPGSPHVGTSSPHFSFPPAVAGRWQRTSVKAVRWQYMIAR